ncbi:MAG: Na+/H+ antiporter subunit E [Dermatophilaceae bacterium]
MMRLWYLLGYIVWLSSEVLRATVRLARDVLTPGLEVSPSIIEFPLRASSRGEIASMASSITITPGTLVLGVHTLEDGSHKSLFVHFMYPHSHQDAIAGLEDMESRLLRVTRGRAEVDR